MIFEYYTVEGVLSCGTTIFAGLSREFGLSVLYGFSDVVSCIEGSLRFEGRLLSARTMLKFCNFISLAFLIINMSTIPV